MMSENGLVNFDKNSDTERVINKAITMFSCFQQSAFHWNIKNLLSLTVTELWGENLHFGISVTVPNYMA